MVGYELVDVGYSLVVGAGYYLVNEHQLMDQQIWWKEQSPVIPKRDYYYLSAAHKLALLFHTFRKFDAFLPNRFM